MGVKQSPNFAQEVKEDVFCDMEDTKVYSDDICIWAQSWQHHQTVVASLNTRPKLSVSVSLLSRHSHNPSSGHLDSEKRALAWLGGTRNHGIHFTQGRTFT
jgi:hypothetical protein